ncbi:Sec-independent protein translocase protein TatB [Methylobacterium sp. A54F]
MLDMSWGEVMLIGGVALIVIGPKDLPKALRTVGQITTKLRRMAGEFHMQFNEAIREAELDEVRREVDGIKRTVGSAGTGFNPVQTIRDELKGAVEGRSQARAADATAPAARSLADATAELREAQGTHLGAPQGSTAPGSFDVPRPDASGAAAAARPVDQTATGPHS